MLLDHRLKSNDMLLRILAYGNAKSRKTWWVGKAAEAGYNVVLLDGDNGWHILKQIAPAAQNRIQVVNMTDERGRPVFAEAMARLLKDGKLIWDEATKKSAKLNPNENCISLDLDQLDSNCVLVVDSWSAYSVSLMLQYAKENQIDMSVAEEGDDKWGYFRWAGALATWSMTQLSGLPCHVVVIAHTDVYEKRSKDGKKVEWSKRQIKSTSGPHAMQMPAKFSDILYFSQKGTANKISTRGNEDADGGSRLIAPGDYNWEDLQFVDIIKSAKLTPPTKDNPFVDYSLKSKSAVVPKSGLITPVVKPVAKVNSLIGKKDRIIDIKLSYPKN
jgi:hypothetical protein